MNKVYIKKVHFIIEILSFVMILGGIIFVIVYASTHPGEMPVHFDMDGNPDEYGSPWTFVFFPISMLVFNGILFVCLHFVNPKNWNVGVTVTATNAVYLYSDISLMLSLLELSSGIYTLGFVPASFFARKLLMPISMSWVALLFVIIILCYCKLLKDRKK